MPTAIEVTDLVKTYPGEVQALRGVSFTVPTGTVFGLLGPNGAGKSTTVKILTTLARADSGTATVAGHDVARAPQAVRRSIGCVFQKAAVDVESTGRENLVLQGQLYGMRGTGLRARSDELLERFGLADAATRLVKTWSGGMQRKLDVALALIHRPPVLFLDEPTTGLDPEARAEMWAELRRLGADEGLTIVLTTHYLDEADHLAAQLAVVDAGRIVVQGSPDELKSRLAGDALAIELADPPAGTAVETALTGVSGLREITVEGRTVRARTENGSRAVPAVIAGLESAGLVAASVAVSRPSLDDVYLRYAGRSFARADAGEAR